MAKPFKPENFRILVIEDDSDIRELIALQLQLKNYNVFCASTAGEGLDMIGKQDYDMFIIDRMLPDTSGIEICGLLRMQERTRLSPILLVTAMAEPENIIEGLDAGADDYITKPFDIEILQARVRTQLRRLSSASRSRENLNAGKLALNEKKRKAQIGEREVKLTHTEFEILRELLKNPGVVYKRRDLIDKILGGDVHVTNRTIDTHIAGLRKKLGEEAALIETIRGVGYRLQDDPSAK